MTRNLPLAWLLLTAVACGGAIEGDEPGECSDDLDNDGDGLFDCADSDCAGAMECHTDPTAPTVPDPTNDPTNPGLQCALEGVYDLASATCNSPLYGPQDYQSIGLIIEDDQSGFGTCRVQVQLVSSACSEVEVWTVADREDGSADLWYDGVDSCLPENCTHFPMDDPCVLQDREWGGAYPIGFSVQGTTIEITGPLGYMLLCDGAMTTNWVRR